MAQPTFTIDVEYGLAVRRGTRACAGATGWGGAGGLEAGRRPER